LIEFGLMSNRRKILIALTFPEEDLANDSVYKAGGTRKVGFVEDEQ